MARRKPGASELIHRWNQGRGPCHPNREWDIARTCRRYERSLKTGASMVRGDGDTQAQYMHFRDALQRAQVCDRQVRQLLYERGVSMCNIVSYCNFARRLARICREYGAATRRNLVQMALDRWCTKGLDREVLLAIAEEVFGVGPGT